MRAAFKRSFSFLSVQYAKNGVPKEVLQLQHAPPLGAVDGTQVKLKILAAPINPSDINMVEGTYAIKAPFPAVAGNEGVALVEEVGSQVKNLKVGDWVIPAIAGLGTWRQRLITDASNVMRVASDIPVPYAATIGVNPCTAYRILHDFVSLKPGDVIIQNGANSMVGFALLQIAREKGVRTINIVRNDRPDVDSVLKLLSNLGGDVNIPSDYLGSSGFNEILRDLPPIKLAINCVGGPSATDLARTLAAGGTMVTYGGMAKKPLKIPFDLIAYKNLQFSGFWMAHWNMTHPLPERQAMIDEVTDLIRKDRLTLFFDMHDLDDFAHALKVYSESFNMRKVVLNIDYPDRLKEHDSLTAEQYWHFEAPVA